MRSNILKYTTLVYAIILFFGCSETPDRKPNILFIAVDDLRPELGCYGNNIIKTPNIDKLANQGVVFRNHFVQVPTCGASRYGLLTGLLPNDESELRNSVIVQKLSEKEEIERPETFIHHLKRNGYYTVGVGKISHHPDNLVYGYNEKPSGQKELPHSWNEFIFNSGKWETGWNAFFGFADGENRQSKKRQVKPYESADVDDNDYPDGLTTEIALKKISELNKIDQPFFLGVGYFKPHLPFASPSKYWDLYNHEEIPLTQAPAIPANINKASLHNSGELNGYQLTDEKASLQNKLSDEYERKLRHAYYACVSYIDAQIGKLLKRLDELNLTDNTVIIIWGDHGWHLGDLLTWGKHTLFEYSLKSPLIIKLPENKSFGISAKGIVETIDIYPTLMEICNIDIPYELDGKSFTNLLVNHEDTGKEAAYGYFNNGITARTERYRITKYFRDEKPLIELYDHKNDFYETDNISSQNRDLVDSLLIILDKGNRFYK